MDDSDSPWSFIQIFPEVVATDKHPAAGLAFNNEMKYTVGY